MTLILTYATPNYLLQVSDRLVTQGTKPFDTASNKNVIYHAKNAIVAIGYSGQAYMDGTTTDQWIAEKLRGEKFRDHEPGRPWALQIGRAERWLDIGQSIELLRHESALLPADDQRQISLAGWQWRRRGRRIVARPILHEIKNALEGSQGRGLQDKALPRYWHYSGDAPDHLSVIPAQNMSKSERTDLRDALRSATQDPQYAEELLVTTIRRAAAKAPEVGADCMVIYMPMPSLRLVKAGYVAGESQASPSAPGLSPWIVGPYSVSAPCEIVGELNARLGLFTVSLAGPSSVTGWHFPPGFPGLPDELKSLVPDEARVRTVSSFSSQKRKGYP